MLTRKAGSRCGHGIGALLRRANGSVDEHPLAQLSHRVPMRRRPRRPRIQDALPQKLVRGPIRQRLVDGGGREKALGCSRRALIVEGVTPHPCGHS